MVKKTFLKECVRSIRGSISRFLAIFAIVALGSGFLAGLLATTPDMRHTVSELYRETNLFDLRIVGNLGLEEADVQALAAIPGVKAVMPARTLDRELLLESGDSLVGRFHAVTQWESTEDRVMNRPVLHEGRWPEQDNECVVEVGAELFQTALGIGSKVKLLPQEKEEDGEEPEDPFRQQELTIVGTVTSGYYVSMAQRGSTTLGSGTLGCILYVQDGLLDMDYYTDIYLVTEDGRSAEAFSQEYEDLIAPMQAVVEEVAETQKHVRADRLRNDAQEELDEARQELADKTAEGEQELADALKELQDGEIEYADGLVELEDGRKEIADGERDLEEGMADLREGKADYEEGLADFREGEQELADAKQELEDGEAELADALKELNDGEAELADALKELNDGEAELADALKELNDGEAELADAKQELEEGEQELADAKQELEEGEAELADALRELNDGEAELADALKELNDGEAELADALKKLEDGERDYADGLKEMEDGEEELEEGEAELDEAYAVIQSGKQELAAALLQLDAGQAELDAGRGLLQEKQAELDAGQVELNANRAYYQDLLDGGAIDQATYDYAMAQLDIKQTEIDTGRLQLEGSFAVLAQKQAELEAGRQACEANKALLESAEAEYEDGVKQLKKARKALKEGKKELADARKELDTGWADYEAGKKELEDGWAEYNDGRKELDQGWVDYETGKQELADGRAEYEDGLKELEDGWAEYNDGRIELDDGWKEYNGGRVELDDGWKEYNEGRAELDDGWKEYNEGRAELDDGWLEYNDGVVELADARVELDDAKQKLEEAEQDLVDGIKELEEAKADLAEGEQELADARVELDDGWKDYEEGKVEFEEKIADANDKIRDAQEQIDDIDEPEWFVLSRSECNEGYIFYDSDTEKVSAIAKVFPVFFFLVAALVASTTMTRMIDEDRGAIGTLKALGYSNRAIAGKYLLYAALACVLGAAVGLSVFLPLFPRVIANVYTMMYQIPPLKPASHLGFILLSAGMILVAVLLATLGALKSSLQDNAAVLMRPKAPPAGKRILLERIRPLWSRMKFTHKVTARNLFRYKKRFLMTVIGVAGCTALLVAGFGLRDSISDIVNVQFTQLQQYDLTVSLEHEGDDTANRSIRRILADKEQVTAYLTAHTETGEGTIPGRDTALTIVVPSDIGAYADYHVFRDRLTGERVPFTAEGAVLTEKAAKVLNIEAGGTLTLSNQDEEEAVIPVSGICENYVQGYVFLSEELYESAFGEECCFDTVFAKTTAADQKARDAMAEALLESDDVSGVSFSTTTIETFADMLASIDYIVILLIVAAAALAFVVLYNLTNINICERQKEIATLKVLGFYKREVSGYIFRETLLLSVIGTAVGLAVGVVFHQFVVLTAEVDAVMFGRVVQPMSYVYSAVLSLLFTVLVSLFMQKKLHRIDMVESLKAPE